MGHPSQKAPKLLTIVLCIGPYGKVALKPHSDLVFLFQAVPASWVCTD